MSNEQEKQLIVPGSIDWYHAQASVMVKEALGQGVQMVVVMRERDMLRSTGSDIVSAVSNAGAIDMQALALWMTEKARYDLWCGFGSAMKEDGK